MSAVERCACGRTMIAGCAHCMTCDQNNGYHACPCRDCMEIAIGQTKDQPDLCLECETAGCQADGTAECCCNEE